MGGCADSWLCGLGADHPPRGGAVPRAERRQVHRPWVPKPGDNVTITKRPGLRGYSRRIHIGSVVGRSTYPCARRQVRVRRAGCRRRLTGRRGASGQPEAPCEGGRPRCEGHLHRAAGCDDVAFLDIAAHPRVGRPTGARGPPCRAGSGRTGNRPDRRASRHRRGGHRAGGCTPRTGSVRCCALRGTPRVTTSGGRPSVGSGASFGRQQLADGAVRVLACLSGHGEMVRSLVITDAVTWAQALLA